MSRSDSDRGRNKLIGETKRKTEEHKKDTSWLVENERKNVKVTLAGTGRVAFGYLSCQFRTPGPIGEERELHSHRVTFAALDRHRPTQHKTEGGRRSHDDLIGVAVGSSTRYWPVELAGLVDRTCFVRRTSDSRSMVQ